MAGEFLSRLAKCKNIVCAIQMRQQFTSLSEIGCCYGGCDHMPTQFDECDKGGQAMDNFTYLHTDIYDPQKKRPQGRFFTVLSKGHVGF
jgi:hypothetical protein